jgi:hypothetical protein
MLQAGMVEIGAHVHLPAVLLDDGVNTARRP